MPLTAVEGDRELWTASVALASKTGAVEYKYLTKSGPTLDVQSWESIPGNRTLTAVAHTTNVAL